MGWRQQSNVWDQKIRLSAEAYDTDKQAICSTKIKNRIKSELRPGAQMGEKTCANPHRIPIPTERRNPPYTCPKRCAFQLDAYYCTESLQGDRDSTQSQYSCHIPSQESVYLVISDSKSQPRIESPGPYVCNRNTDTETETSDRHVIVQFF